MKPGKLSNGVMVMLAVFWSGVVSCISTYGILMLFAVPVILAQPKYSWEGYYVVGLGCAGAVLFLFSWFIGARRWIRRDKDALARDPSAAMVSLRVRFWLTAAVLISLGILLFWAVQRGNEEQVISSLEQARFMKVRSRLANGAISAAITQDEDRFILDVRLSGSAAGEFTVLSVCRLPLEGNKELWRGSMNTVPQSTEQRLQFLIPFSDLSQAYWQYLLERTDHGAQSFGWDIFLLFEVTAEPVITDEERRLLERNAVEYQKSWKEERKVLFMCNRFGCEIRRVGLPGEADHKD